MHCRYCGAEMGKRQTKCLVCGSTAKVAGCEDWAGKNAQRTMILDGEKVSYSIHGHGESGDYGCDTGEEIGNFPVQEREKSAAKGFLDQLLDLWNDKEAKGARAFLKILLAVVFFIIVTIIEALLEML